MTTNSYMNHTNDSSEQNLIKDLVTESIKFFGQDVQYYPRTADDTNDLFNEDETSSFDSAFTIEAYLETFDGLEGGGHQLEKFGMTFQDEITLSMSPARFTTVTSMARPLEGDLILVDYGLGTKKRIFEIKHVSDKKPFFQLGTQTMWNLTLELFEYSHESLSTGDTDVDILETDYDTLAEDSTAQNAELEVLGTAVTGFDQGSPFGDF